MRRYFLLGIGLTWALSFGSLGCSDDDDNGPNIDAAVWDAGDGHVGQDAGDGGADAADGYVPPQTDCEGVDFVDCTPREGSNGATLLVGTVITPDHVLCNGQVLISRDSEHIECVAEDCSGEALAANATVICADVITPGLIDSHNHMTYNTLPPWHHPGKLYEHRDEWRNDPDFNAYDARLSSGDAPVADRYSEFRLLMAATTGVHKSSGRTATYTGVRNLDRGSDGNDLGLPSGAIEECVFPLSSSCRQEPDYSNLDPDLRAYVIHLSEGINQRAYDEYDRAMQGGHIGSRTSIIHGVSFDGPQLAELAGLGVSLIWSPQSNVDLYGQTANVTAAWNMGLNVALAPDWTVSGTMNLLSELKCAQHLDEKYYASRFNSRDLVAMVTSNAARALGIDDLIGYLRPGHYADVAAMSGDRVHPYDTVLQANSDTVRAVFISGAAFYGDADALNADIEYNEFCEDIDVCGASKRICVKEEAGSPAQPLNPDDWAKFSYQDYVDYLQGRLDQLKAQNNPAPEDDYLYELFPAFECTPSFHCDLGNEYVPGEITADDNDGDGVSNAEDNCPDIFNPGQGDFDTDGVGDSCDPCPYAEDENNCPRPDPTDKDGDGIANADDNCPSVANPDQADGDNDGVGDVCDACPDYSNPNGAPCPATIYEIKTGVYQPGAAVLVQDVVVTGVGADGKGFFLQVPADHASYNGPDHSGLFVYIGTAGNAPSVGDRVDVSGVVADFYGQTQVSSVSDITVVSSGNTAPAPVDVTPAEVTTGGSRAEALEAVVVRVQNVSVTDTNPTTGPGDHDPINEFVVDSSLRIDDYMYLVTPFPQVGDTFTAISGVLRFANGDSKLEPRSAADVVTGPPALAGFSRILSFAYVGETGEPVPGLELRLTGPAQGATTISLSSSATNVLTVPATVIVPDGQQAVVVSVTGVAAASNPVTVTATLDGDTADTQVRVLDGTEQPAVVAIDPASASVRPSDSLDFTVTLDLPARSGGETVTVTTGALLSGPGTVTVPARAMEASFTVTAGASEGNDQVTASLGASSQSAAVTISQSAASGLILAQVFYDINGSDDGYEWIQLYNGTSHTIDLSSYSLAWGGTDYGWGSVQLSGSIQSGACFIVGGPTSSAENGNPTYDLAVNLDQDLQNSGSDADAVALFDVPASSVTGSTVPIDAVIYGGSNSNGLIDETGQAGDVDVGDAPAGNALLRTGEHTWEIAPVDPSNCPAF